MKQHTFFNAGGETVTEQTELIIDVVKVIANVFTNLWTSAPQESREPREAGREDAVTCVQKPVFSSNHFWRWR